MTYERNSQDPRLVTVQINVRVPWFYREQLAAEAERREVSVNQLFVQCLHAAVPPKEPKA